VASKVAVFDVVHVVPVLRQERGLGVGGWGWGLGFGVWGLGFGVWGLPERKRVARARV